MTVKLLSGGGMPAFVSYRPVTTTMPSGTTTSSTTSTKSDELSNKDLLKALDKIDGLPSDMAALKDNLITAISSPGTDLFGSTDSLFGSTGLIATQYANTILGIKIANYSKNRYDEVKKTLDQNGGLNEIAVTDTGGVIVSDSDGNIKPISVDEYLANKSKYKTFTNSNLLYMRAYNSNYANNDTLMNIAGAGIGLTEINKQIKAALGNLGKSEQTSESYNVLQGAEVIKEIYEKTGETKLEGLYKLTNKSSNQTKQAKAALDYIWGMLPENSKAVLKLKAGSEKGAYEMIAGFVASGTTDVAEHKESYILDKDGQKPGSKKSSSGSDGKYKPGVVSNFIRGNGSEESFVIVNGTSDGLRVTGVRAPLTTNTGKVGGAMSLAEANKGGFGPILDWLNISMGGVHISDAHLSEIMCTDGIAHSVDFPTTTDSAGNVTPNYKLFAAKESADREVKRLGLIPENDWEKINEIYKKHNVPAKYDSEGTLNTDSWGRFAVMQAVALSKAFDEDQSFNNLLKEVGDNELESYLHSFNQEAKISGTQEAKGKDIEFDKKSWWDNLFSKGQHWYSSYDTMFKGTVFIPIKADEIMAMAGDNSKTYIGETEEIAGLQQDHDLQSEYNDPGSLDE